MGSQVMLHACLNSVKAKLLTDLMSLMGSEIIMKVPYYYW